MKHKKRIALTLGLALITAGCATAVQLEGLSALTDQIRPAANTQDTQPSGPLQVVADAAEESSEYLDIVQIGIDEENDLVVFAIFDIPETNDTDASLAKFQASVEAIWQAAVDRNLPVENIAIASMRIISVSTLDRGLAPVGWLIGGLQVPLVDVSNYLSGTINEQSRAEFWLNSVQAVPLDQPYVGVPNHTVRSLEA